jgi:hypothetical protein
LNRITRTLYGRGAQVVFYKATPAAGETAIATITSGFHFQRERRAGQEIDGSGVRMWLSKDAAITRSQLNPGGVVALTVDGITTRYKIGELLPMQQLGSGYTIRLEPLTGATR